MNYGIKNTTSSRQENAYDSMAKMEMMQERGSLYRDDPKIKSRPAQTAMTNLEKDLHALGERLNELNNRLAPVSMPEAEIGAVPPPTPQNGCSPLARGIEQADEMVRRLMNQVHNMIERLEV